MKAIAAANRVKADYARTISEAYETKARSCLGCSTPGACCLDAHFVNVHITRLEAAAINKVLAGLSDWHRKEVQERIVRSVETFGLSADGETFSQKFACPLYEKGVGCLVHSEGKPLPCIQHACYERPEDLPPDELLESATDAIEKLNRRCYGEPARWLPLPVWLVR